MKGYIKIFLVSLILGFLSPAFATNNNVITVSPADQAPSYYAQAKQPTKKSVHHDKVTHSSEKNTITLFPADQAPTYYVPAKKPIQKPGISDIYTQEQIKQVVAAATARAQMLKLKPLSYVPRFYLTALGGSSLLGQVDMLAPLYQEQDRNLFTYGQFEYSNGIESWDDNPMKASLGLGYRQIYGDTSVLGGYVFADWSQSPGNYQYWVISPGVESLGKIWDFRANGYFPLGQKSWKHEGWADKFGIDNYIWFEGHNQHNDWMLLTENVGYGADAEVGRKLFSIKHMPVKAFVNGYYFGIKDDTNITGIGGRITLQASKSLTLMVSDSYDNHQHNVIMAGVRISLNELHEGLTSHVDDQDLQNRLFDPIERNLGTLDSASSVPVTTHMQNFGPGIEYNNVVFVQPGTGDGGDGTFEDPYIGFDQGVADAAENEVDDARFYFAPGSYDMSGNVALDAGQSMWGRTADYKDDSSNNTFTGALTLKGCNSLNYINLQNDAGTYATGITMNGASGVSLDHVTVGVNNGSNKDYVTGISMTNSTATLAHSNIYANANVSIVRGISMDNSTLTLDHSNISAYANNPISNARGIELKNGDTLNIGDGNYISATASGTGDSNAFGIYAHDAPNSIINIYGSYNTIVASVIQNTSDESIAIGIFMNLDNNAKLNISGNSNTFSVNNADTSSQSFGARGIDLEYSTGAEITINGKGTTFNIQSSSASVPNYGIKTDVTGSNVNVQNSTFNITGVDDYGIYDNNFSSDDITRLRDNSNNTFNVANDVGPPPP